MEKYVIYLIVIIVLYLLYKELTRSNNETFQTTTTGYQTDIEAIRNLSNIASQLTISNTLTNPASLKITSKLSTNNLDPNNMPDGWSGGIRTFDAYASGTIACGPDGKQVKSFINSNGAGYFSSDITTDGNLILGGNNKWLLHTPEDSRKSLFIAPWSNNIDGSGNAGWHWAKMFVIDSNGNATINGNLTVNGNMNMNGKVAMNNNPIMLRSMDDNNHYIKYSATTDGPEIGACGGLNITSGCKPQYPYINMNDWKISLESDQSGPNTSFRLSRTGGKYYQLFGNGGNSGNWWHN